MYCNCIERKYVTALYCIPQSCTYLALEVAELPAGGWWCLKVYAPSHCSSPWASKYLFCHSLFSSFMRYGETVHLTLRPLTGPLYQPRMIKWWVWSSRWNENKQGNPKYSDKSCPSATLFTKNLTLLDLGSNPGRRCGKPATNRLSYGTALCHKCLEF
jgi:hypothetical protein